LLPVAPQTDRLSPDGIRECETYFIPISMPIDVAMDSTTKHSFEHPSLRADDPGGVIRSHAYSANGKNREWQGYQAKPNGVRKLEDRQK
jgi:hypothetical protein